MTFRRFTINRLSKSLLALLISFQVVACSSSSSPSNEDITGVIPTLSWVAPSEREDGTPISLSEIAGYRVYYGSSMGSYPNQIDIMDGSAVQANLSSLFPGLYYFVVTTLDTDGRESSFSDEVSIAL